MSYDYRSYDYQINDRLDTGTTIGVRSLGKLATAQITYASGTTSPAVSLQLYRNGKGYVSEETNIHLCNKKEGVPSKPLRRGRSHPSHPAGARSRSGGTTPEALLSAVRDPALASIGLR